METFSILEVLLSILRNINWINLRLWGGEKYIFPHTFQCNICHDGWFQLRD